MGGARSGGGGGRGTLYNALNREALPKWGTVFSGFRYMKGKQFTWEWRSIILRLGISVNVVCTKDLKENKCILWLWKKTGKLPGLVISTYLKDGAFTEVKRDAAF